MCAICKHRHALKHTYKHTHSCRVSLETHSNVPEKFAKASQAKPDLNLQIITFFVASSFPSPLHVPSICLSPRRRIRVSPLQSLFSPSGKTEYCHHFPGGASCQEANYHCWVHHNTHTDAKNVNACSHAYVRTLTHIQDDFFSFNERGKVKDTHTLPLYLLWLPAHLLSAKDKELCTQQIQQKHTSYKQYVCIYWSCSSSWI